MTVFTKFVVLQWCCFIGISSRHWIYLVGIVTLHFFFDIDFKYSGNLNMPSTLKKIEIDVVVIELLTNQNLLNMPELFDRIREDDIGWYCLHGTMLEY